MMPNKFNSTEVELSALRELDKVNCDLFICSASYEPRCLSVPLAMEQSTPKSVLVLKNAGVVGNGSRHASQIVEHFGATANIIETTKKAAVRTADVVSIAIQERLPDTDSRVVVDVTTMTHETLLVLFRLLEILLTSGRNEIVYLYNPAKEYDPGTPYEKKWLSKGVDRVGSVLGFSGNLLPSKRNHLVILVGFEVNRASGLIDVFEPSTMSFGYGDQSSFSEEHRKINEAKHRRLSDKYPRAEHFEFSPSDAYTVRDQILELASSHSNSNLIVAPMNTKISTLGCGLAALQNPSIQLCYASAVTYNSENYASPSNRCLIFQC